MERKMLKRYLILITVLMIFAGAAWYFTQDSGAPQAGAVLARLQDSGGVRVRSEQAGAVLAGPETRMPETQPTRMQPEISFLLGEEVSHGL